MIGSQLNLLSIFPRQRRATTTKRGIMSSTFGLSPNPSTLPHSHLLVMEMVGADLPSYEEAVNVIIAEQSIEKVII